MQTFLALLLALASVVGYFVLAAQFGVRQAVPWPHFLVSAAAVIWLWRLLRQSEGLAMKLRRGAALVFALFLGVASVWYALDYSAYSQKGESFEARQIAGLAELQLTDHQGTSRRWLEASTPTTLLVLYRGYW